MINLDVPRLDGSHNFTLFLSFLVFYGIILIIGVVMCTMFTIALHRGRRVLMQALETFPNMVRDSVGSNDSRATRGDINETLHLFEEWGENLVPILSNSMRLLELIPNKGLLYISMLMTLNRMAVFVYPSWRRIFDRGTVRYPIIICWVLLILMSTLTALLSTTQRFNRETLRLEDNGDPILDSGIALNILQGLDNMIPLIIAIMYVRIYVAIRSIRTNPNIGDSHSRNRFSEDRKMLKQSLIICKFLVLYNLIGLVVIFTEQGSWAQRILGMGELILSALNHTMHSAVFILTNSTIQKFLPIPLRLRMIMFNRKKQGVATASDNHFH